MAYQRERGSRDDHAWSVVPAHGVERYGDWSTHFLRADLENTSPLRPLGLRPSGRGNPRE
jgi:hypothetical protein